MIQYLRKVSFLRINKELAWSKSPKQIAFSSNVTKQCTLIFPYKTRIFSSSYTRGIFNSANIFRMITTLKRTFQAL